MKWEDIVIIGALAVTFLNKQVANVSRPWCSYCSEAGETVFLLKKKKRGYLLPSSRSEPHYNLGLGKESHSPLQDEERGLGF